MKSAVGAEFDAAVPPIPAVPVITGVAWEGDTAMVSVQMSPVDTLGRPLPTLSQVEVFYREKGLVGEIEALIEEVFSTLPSVKMPLTAEQIGQVVVVPVPGLTRANYGFAPQADA